MKWEIKFKDRSTEIITSESDYKLSLKAWDLGSRFTVNGNTFEGSDISKIIQVKDSFKPFQEAEAAGFLPEGERTMGFWQIVLGMNKKRQGKGKKWIYAGLIEYLKSTHRLTTPKEIFDWIDEHEGQHMDLNVPDKSKVMVIGGGCGKCENGVIYFRNRFGEVEGKYCTCKVVENDTQNR